MFLVVGSESYQTNIVLSVTQPAMHIFDTIQQLLLYNQTKEQN